VQVVTERVIKQSRALV